MKWFCYLFSFYILLLSGLPCTDGNCDQQQNTLGNPSTFTVTAAHAGSPEKHDFDSCSPVCACHCCSVSFTLRAVEPLSFTWCSSPVVKQRFPSLSVLIKDVTLTIDRPPQLV